jgi:hypothetical protein
MSAGGLGGGGAGATGLGASAASSSAANPLTDTKKLKLTIDVIANHRNMRHTLFDLSIGTRLL